MTTLSRWGGADADDDAAINKDYDEGFSRFAAVSTAWTYPGRRREGV